MSTSVTAAALADLPARKVNVVTFWLASGGFALGAGEFASMGLLPSFASALHVDEATAGHAISAYALGVVIGAPLIAIFAARLPRKPVLLALLALFVTGNALSAAAPNFTTLECGRFVSGIPHGAFFAIAMLLAASMAAPKDRAKAVSKVSLGLAVATIVGVPVITLAGTHLGWRSGFVIVGALGSITLGMLWRTAPHPERDVNAHPSTEVRALKNPRVLLTLAIGAIGFGGMFSVYSYFSSVFTSSKAGPEWVVSAILMVYGVGVTLGNLLAGRLAHGRTLQVTACFQALLGLACAGYALSVGNAWAMAAMMMMVGLGAGMSVPLQTRLMDVAGNAQTLAAALNHVAFNLANALGPFLAGLTISAGWGGASTGWVGVVLAGAGLALLAAAGFQLKRHDQALLAEARLAAVVERKELAHSAA